MTEAKLSERTMLEIAEHEGLVLEAYLCSAGEWTWGFGVTGASGHIVFPRYRNNPSTLQRAVEVYEWLLRTKYLPEVEWAFRGVELSEAQTAAALSFHWNTGGILVADWVKSFVGGRTDRAMREIMNWSKPREIISRRKAERALFFDEVWTHDGFVTHYARVHKNGTPDWGSARRVDIRPALRAALGQAEA